MIINIRVLIGIFFIISFTSNAKKSDLKKITFTLNGQKLIKILQNGRFIALTSISGDTIVKYQHYYERLKILDINGDGSNDIRVYIMSNTPNQCDNYLFNIAKRKFKLLENCNLDIKLVTGTKLFYSYNRAGCADYNWQSYLSKIVNFKLIPIGYIYGNGCESNNNQQVIEIYKINPNNQVQILIKKLPYLKNIPVFDAKWGFIEKYWSKNYLKFK